MGAMCRRSAQSAVRQGKLAGLDQNPFRAIILLVFLLILSWSQYAPSSSMHTIIRMQPSDSGEQTNQFYQANSQTTNEYDEDDFLNLDQAAIDRAPKELVTDSAYSKEYPGASDVKPSVFTDVLIPSQFASKEANAGRFKHGTITRKFKNGDSAAQFIYLVGVEGAGHHGVAVLLEHMARYANMNFYMRDRRTRRGIRHHDSGMLAKAMKSRIEDTSGRKHVILEDNSFPTRGVKRHNSFKSIKQEPRYDLEWIIKESEKSGVDVKLLLLSRPFMNQVWSHKKWDGGFKGHASTLAHFMAYINKEMSTIDNENIWRRIDYTWFSDEICPQVVPKLADFLNWPVPKDVTVFCKNTPFYLSKKQVDVSAGTMRWTQNLINKYKPIWGVYERSDMALTQITQTEDSSDENEDEEEDNDVHMIADSTVEEDSSIDDSNSEENSEEGNSEEGKIEEEITGESFVDTNAAQEGGTDVDESENEDKQTEISASNDDESGSDASEEEQQQQQQQQQQHENKDEGEQKEDEGEEEYEAYDRDDVKQDMTKDDVTKNDESDADESDADESDADESDADESDADESDTDVTDANESDADEASTSTNEKQDDTDVEVSADYDESESSEKDDEEPSENQYEDEQMSSDITKVPTSTTKKNRVKSNFKSDSSTTEQVSETKMKKMELGNKEVGVNAQKPEKIVENDDDFPQLNQEAMNDAPEELAADDAYDQEYIGSYDVQPQNFSDLILPNQFASKEANMGRFEPGTIQRKFMKGNSAAQFIYLVGVEGAGHHGVAILLEHMARYANMNFYMRDRRTRHGIRDHDGEMIVDALKSRVQDTSGRKHIILEDNSFPTAHTKRGATFREIKKVPRYDLEWIIKQAERSGASVKMLLLSRPFMNQVWSHKEWDGGFKPHAKVLGHFMSYINHEIKAINKDEIWRHIDYTWFSGELCPQVVPKLADFLNWPVPKDVFAFCKNTPFYLSKKEVSVGPGTLRWASQFMRRNKKNWNVYERPDKDLLEIL